MNDKRPDFYLISSEHRDLKEPRCCWVKGRIAGEVRNDGMWIRISPALIGQKYGLGEKNIEEFILFSRLKGTTLFPINEWPLHVYIYRVLNEAVFKSKKFKESEVTMLAWGEIYPTLREAETEYKKIKNSGQ